MTCCPHCQSADRYFNRRVAEGDLRDYRQHGASGTTRRLLEALKSPAFYVGAIGSQKNNDARRRRLKQFDLSDDEIARLHGPVGLPIGSRTPPEIAVSILAEMTAVRRGITLVGARAASSTAEPDPFACRM